MPKNVCRHRGRSPAAHSPGPLFECQSHQPLTELVALAGRVKGSGEVVLSVSPPADRQRPSRSENVIASHHHPGAMRGCMSKIAKDTAAMPSASLMSNANG